jgi:hypothetical protein
MDAAASVNSLSPRCYQAAAAGGGAQTRGVNGRTGARGNRKCLDALGDQLLGIPPIGNGLIAPDPAINRTRRKR